MNIKPFHPRLPKRFLDKILVDPTSGCWTWQAATDRDGYAKFHADDRTVLGHRWAYQQVHGVTLHPRAYACHSCDQPGCVNPAHIRPGTARFNSRDMTRKGRQSSKLTPRDVWSLRCLHAIGAYEAADLAAIYGVHETTVRQALSGETWRHVPFPDRAEPDTVPEFDSAGQLLHNPSRKAAA